MKVVFAAHGTRGDVEPCAAVGLELLRRGHEVRMAVPPDLVRFVESAGLTAVGYGPDSQEQGNAVRDEKTDDHPQCGRPTFGRTEWRLRPVQTADAILPK